MNLDSAPLSFLHVRRYAYEEIASKFRLPLIEDREGAFVPFFVPTYRAVDDGYRFLSAAETFSGYARQCGFSIVAECRVRV